MYIQLSHRTIIPMTPRVMGSSCSLNVSAESTCCHCHQFAPIKFSVLGLSEEIVVAACALCSSSCINDCLRDQLGAEYGQKLMCLLDIDRVSSTVQETVLCDITCDPRCVLDQARCISRCLHAKLSWLLLTSSHQNYLPLNP